MVDTSSALSAAITLVGVLLWLLVRARRKRRKDPYEETLRKLSDEGRSAQPIRPSGDLQEAFDEGVDQLARGCNLFHTIVGVLVLGVVIYVALTDVITRYILLGTFGVITIIWLVWRTRKRDSSSNGSA